MSYKTPFLAKINKAMWAFLIQFISNYLSVCYSKLMMYNICYNIRYFTKEKTAVFSLENYKNFLHN